MELALPHGDEATPQYAKVTKRLRDANGIPIGTADDNPILDMRMYDIAENLFAQVDQDGNHQVLLDEIIDYCTTGKEVKQQDAFITTRTGTKRRHETTIGWELLVQWKDSSMNWIALKDLKESYPVQVAEYSVGARISMEPAFAWWVPYMLKKCNRIIAKSNLSTGFGLTSLGSGYRSRYRRQKSWTIKMVTTCGGRQFARR